MRKRIQQASGPPALFCSDGQGIKPVIVGHRGAPSVARENTLASFTAAFDEGAAWVELDVRRAGDGTLTVHHDPVISDGRAIVDLDRVQLEKATIATLDDVLAGLPDGLGVDLEVKNLPGEPDYDESQQVAALLSALVRPLAGTRPLLSTSFNPMTVQALGEHLSEVPTGLVFSPGLRTDAAADLARDLGCAVLCPHVDARPLDAGAMAAAHEAGLQVMVWVVDDLDVARNLAAAGADALCTNEPGRLVRGLGD
jgi:glycerophosphoryl diester phosphodiesterase